MSSRFLNILSLALFLVVLPFTAPAQQGNVIIQGTVVDQSGGALSGVAVTALNDETGVSRSTVTDSVGHYRLPALQSGVYSLRVEHPGFSAEERKSIQLTVGQEVVANFSMKVGKVDSVGHYRLPALQSGVY